MDLRAVAAAYEPLPGGRGLTMRATLVLLMLELAPDRSLWIDTVARKLGAAGVGGSFRSMMDLVRDMKSLRLVQDDGCANRIRLATPTASRKRTRAR